MLTEQRGHLHEQHFQEMSAWQRAGHAQRKSTPTHVRGSVAQWAALKRTDWGVVMLQYFQKKKALHGADVIDEAADVKNRTKYKSVTARKMSHRNHILF